MQTDDDLVRLSAAARAGDTGRVELTSSFGILPTQLPSKPL